MTAAALLLGPVVWRRPVQLRPCGSWAAQHGPARNARNRARGQSTVLMVVMLFATVGMALAVAEIGQILDESARARTAADAAALAGASEGEAAAAEIAAANGASLVFFEEIASAGAEERTVTVEVRVGRASQRARAAATVEWAAPG